MGDEFAGDPLKKLLALVKILCKGYAKGQKSLYMKEHRLLFFNKLHKKKRGKK